MGFSLMRLTTISRQLYIPVPRALARELGWPSRGYVKVARGPEGTVTVQLLQEEPRGTLSHRGAAATPDPAA